MQALITNAIWFYLVIVNLYLFGLMFYDKRQAVKQKWRVPESNLLFMGIIGGGLGGLLAQRIFRHKTLKVKFTICFIIGIVVDALLLTLVFI
ncbi:MAG: DUF1294 domain-containing protein [Enterococcus sp.]